jgi:hypothetical protein
MKVYILYYPNSLPLLFITCKNIWSLQILQQKVNESSHETLEVLSIKEFNIEKRGKKNRRKEKCLANRNAFKIFYFIKVPKGGVWFQKLYGVCYWARTKKIRSQNAAT